MIERISYKLMPIALLAMALYAVGARADNDADTSMFSFSGFGTLGVVHSSEDQADFTKNAYFKPDGAGYTHDWSLSVDSLIGAQISADFTPQLSGILQVISEQNYDGSYRPHVEWANIQYQFTPDSSVRIGRIILPSFLLSDSRKVAYTNPWVRPPLEIYHIVPVSISDGIDASHRLHFGDVTNTVQALYGYNDAKLPDGSHVTDRKWGIFNTTEYGALTVHMAYHQARLDFKGMHPFFDAFRQFGAEGVAIADRYDCNDKLAPLASIGVSYDPGQWFLMGEFAKSKTHCVVGAQTGWYVSGGYRIGPFTPYLTYAVMKADSNTSDPGLSFDPAGLNPALNAILGSIPVQNTISVGGRWDFAKSFDLKLQYDRIHLGTGSPGTLSNTQPGFQPGGKVNVFSATIDFVF
ncbi:hypothetical protein [Thiobacillus sp.]